MRKIFDVYQSVTIDRRTPIFVDESLNDLSDSEILKLYQNGDERIEVGESDLIYDSEELNSNISDYIEFLDYEY